MKAKFSLKHPATGGLVYFDSAQEMAEYQARLDAETRADSDGRVLRCDAPVKPGSEPDDPRERMIRRDQEAWKNTPDAPAAAPTAPPSGEREDAAADAHARYLDRIRQGQG